MLNQKIRQNVFETNSSSTHSITISETYMDGVFMDNSLIPNEMGELIFNTGTFGWEVCDYNDAHTKATYLAMYASKYWPKDKVGGQTLGSILKSVLKKQTGAKRVAFDFEGYDTYIDHQSVENKNFHWVFETPERIRQFIFNPKSVLHTDNDNY